MTEKIKDLFAKYKEIVLYIIFGVLTTVVSFVLYYVCLWLCVHYIVSQVLSWIGAVIFAFVVNKLFVFGDRDNSRATLIRQLGQFVGVRLASGVLETALLWLLVDIILLGADIAKIPVAVLTVILNYIASKLIVFRNKGDKDEA